MAKKYTFAVVTRKAVTNARGTTKMVDNLVFGKNVYNSAKECITANVDWIAQHPMTKFMIWEEDGDTPS